MNQAEAELRRALEIQGLVDLKDTIRTASIALNLARVLTAQGNRDEAKTFEIRARKIQAQRAYTVRVR